MSIRAYSDICLHLVWHTKQSLPLIPAAIEDRLHRHLKHRIASTPGCYCHEVGGTDNHVHSAVNIPPTLNISEWIGELKGASSHYINHLDGRRWPRLAWQQGYGVVSVSRKHLASVKDHIRNQKQHHQSGTLLRYLEVTESDRDG